MIATQKFNSNLAWRLPLWIQVVMPAINAGLILFCPESPRWLYSVGKVDQARTILAGLHSKTNDVNSPLIKHEMEEIERAILQDGADKRWWDFRPLFKTRAQRARMWMVVLVGAFGQLSGNGMVTYFLTVLLRIAGITDQGKQITLNFVNSVTSMIGAVTGAFIVDSFGRRRLLLTGTITLVVILAIASGLLSDPTTSQARANAGITVRIYSVTVTSLLWLTSFLSFSPTKFIYLFMVAFSFGWTPMQSLYPAEVLTFDMRTKGLALYTLVAQAASCINTFGLPVALDKMGFWCYVMFCLWDVFEVAIIYFTVVETKGLTLEEVEEVFENVSRLILLTCRFRYICADIHRTPAQPGQVLERARGKASRNCSPGTRQCVNALHAWRSHCSHTPSSVITFFLVVRKSWMCTSSSILWRPNGCLV